MATLVLCFLQLLYNCTTTTTLRASPPSGEMQEKSWLPAESSSCIRAGCRDELKAALVKPTWSTCRALAGVSTHDNCTHQAMGYSTSWPQQCPYISTGSHSHTSEPAGAAGSKRFIPLDIFFIPVHSSQTPGCLQCASYASPSCFATFLHGSGCPTPGLMQPEAPGAGLPPCCQPWFAMLVLAAASALPLPRPSHCPTCTCSPSAVDAGDGVGPQCPDSQ